MDSVRLMINYFWLMALIMTIINGRLLLIKARPYIEKNPSLDEGYQKLSKGFSFWGGIPWLLMGLGILTGQVPSTLHYFRPSDGNPFVLVWFLSIFFLWILGSYWLFIKNGAEFLLRYSGVINPNIRTTKMVKLLWLLILAGGIAGTILMFSWNLPIDKLL